MKLTAACIPEGDQDLVHLCCAVGQLFSLFLSDIVAQNWYNPEGYICGWFTRWSMPVQGEAASKKIVNLS